MLRSHKWTSPPCKHITFPGLKLKARFSSKICFKNWEQEPLLFCKIRSCEKIHTYIYLNLGSATSQIKMAPTSILNNGRSFQLKLSIRFLWFKAPQDSFISEFLRQELKTARLRPTTRSFINRWKLLLLKILTFSPAAGL